MNQEIELSWYAQLKEELDSLVTEMRFNVRWQLIEWNHKIGETIRGHAPHGELDKCLQTLSHDLSVSKRSLYNAVAIYDAYPDISQIPDGKNASMNKLLKAMGKDSKEECTHLDKKMIEICNTCGKKI